MRVIVRGSAPDTPARYSARSALHAPRGLAPASGVALATMLVASIACAEIPVRPVQLVYAREPGAETCPDDEALRQAVRDRLGYDPFDAAAEAKLSTTIARRRGRLEARIDLRGPSESGSQEIRGGTDCSGLASALVVAVALAIDPLALERPEAPRASNEAPPVSPPERSRPAAVRTKPPPAKSPPAKARPIALRTIAELSIAEGMTPRLAVGTIVGVEVGWRRLSAGLEWQSYLPTSEASGSGALVRASVSKGAMLGCVTFGRVAGCGLFSAGGIRGVGSGAVDRARSETSAYASVGARLGARLPLARGFSVRLHGDIEVPLIDTRLVVGRSTLFETSSVAFGGGLGLCVDLF